MPSLKPSLKHAMHLRKQRLRYAFTAERVELCCGTGLLQPAGPEAPTATLSWKSGRKHAAGGTVRAVAGDGAATSGATWDRPITLTCSVYKAGQRFEPRPAEFSLRIDGVVGPAANKKLVAAVDLAAHTSFDRTTAQLTLPLPNGMGMLRVTLSSTMVKADADDDDRSQSSVGTAMSAKSAKSFAAVAAAAAAGHDTQDPSASSLSSAGADEPNGVGRRVSPLKGLSLSPATLRRASNEPGGGADDRGARVERPASAAGAPFATNGAKVCRSGSVGNLAAAGGACGGGGGASSSSEAAAPPRAIARANSFGSPRARVQRSSSFGLKRPGIGGGGGGESRAAAAVKAGLQLLPVEPEEMEVVLDTTLSMSLDTLQECLLGMDSEHSAFGALLCDRLGYMQVNADSWAGSETEGLTRAVSLVVKCPPKPMLPETTRVKLRHRLQRYEGARLVLEREIATLDVPYGETFCVQERWEATTVDDGSRGAASNRTPRGGGVADDALLDVDIDDGGPQLVRLLVRSHVHFRSKLGLMNAKIKHHSIKKSRKMATLAVQLLLEAARGVGAAPDSSAVGGPTDELPAEAHLELQTLRAQCARREGEPWEAEPAPAAHGADAPSPPLAGTRRCSRSRPSTSGRCSSSSGRTNGSSASSARRRASRSATSCSGARRSRPRWRARRASAR